MALEIIDGTEVDLDELDERLAELTPLIRRWARSDDLDRELAIDAATTEELLDLWHTIKPRFPIINAYLDGQDDAEARLLHSLSQAAIEAAFAIERRTGTDLLASN